METKSCSTINLFSIQNVAIMQKLYTCLHFNKPVLCDGPPAAAAASSRSSSASPTPEVSEAQSSSIFTSISAHRGWLLLVSFGVTKGSRKDRTAKNFHFFPVLAADPLLFPSSFSLLFSLMYLSLRDFHFLRHTSTDKKVINILSCVA